MWFYNIQRFVLIGLSEEEIGGRGLWLTKKKRGRGLCELWIINDFSCLLVLFLHLSATYFLER